MSAAIEGQHDWNYRTSNGEKGSELGPCVEYMTACIYGCVRAEVSYPSQSPNLESFFEGISRVFRDSYL